VPRAPVRYTTALMPPVADTIFNLIILLMAALIQGFFGFGYGIAAMSGLAFTQDLIHAAGVVNITGVLIMGRTVFRLRRHILRTLVLRMLPAALVGVVLGVTALRHMDGDLMISILGLSIVVVSAWNLVKPRLRSWESPWLDRTVAVLGGLLCGAFNTGGPPFIIHIYRRPEDPEVLRATIQSIFLAMGLSRLPISAAQGLLTGPVWLEAAVLAPGAIVGIILGTALARRVPADRFRRACWIALGLLGVALLAAG
jgi:uncharacterized membrane protein YfcA